MVCKLNYAGCPWNSTINDRLKTAIYNGLNTIVYNAGILPFMVRIPPLTTKNYLKSIFNTGRETIILQWSENYY